MAVHGWTRTIWNNPSEGVKSLGKCPRRIGLVSQGLVVHRLSGAVNQLLSRRRTCSRRRPQAIARHRRRLRGPQPLLGVTRPVGGWAALLRRSPIRLDSPPDSASCIAFVETDAANDDRPRALCFSPHEQAGVRSRLRAILARSGRCWPSRGIRARSLGPGNPCDTAQTE